MGVVGKSKPQRTRRNQTKTLRRGTEEAEDWKKTGGTRLELQERRKSRTQTRGNARGAAKRGKIVAAEQELEG
jgi:hypothetical protein